MVYDWRYGPMGLGEEQLSPWSPCAAGVTPRGRFSGDRMAQTGPLGIGAETAMPLLPADAMATVEAYLKALGKDRAPNLVRRRVETAAKYFECCFPGKSFADIVSFLQGVDFSREVRVRKLSQAIPVGRLLVQWLQPPPAAAGESRPGPEPPGWRLGNFFSTWGHAVETLGVARGARQPQRYRVKNGGVDVLVSRTTSTVDDHTPGRVRHTRMRVLDDVSAYVGEMVGGGGLQIVIPDPVAIYVETV